MTDVASIANALASLKTATEIVAFFKSSDLSLEKAEAKLKLADLITALAAVRTDLADTQDELLQQRETIRNLTHQLNSERELTYEAPAYWKIKEGHRDGPFCQRCYDVEIKQVRLQKFENGYLQCKNCSNGYETEAFRRCFERKTDHDYDIYE